MFQRNLSSPDGISFMNDKKLTREDEIRWRTMCKKFEKNVTMNHCIKHKNSKAKLFITRLLSMYIRWWKNWNKPVLKIFISILLRDKRKQSNQIKNITAASTQVTIQCYHLKYVRLWSVIFLLLLHLINLFHSILCPIF